MKNENLIGINVANAVSILIMGAIGALLLVAARKAATARSGATQGALANGY